MKSLNSLRSSALLTLALVAGGSTLSACATQDYVDQHIAAANMRIDTVNSSVVALTDRVGAVEVKAQEALQRADSAGGVAQQALANAQRANERLDQAEMKPKRPRN